MNDVKWPKVSVIFMCWNIGHYVIEAIESVLESKYPNLEIICLEDSSEDGVSRDLLIEYFSRNKIGKLVLNENNLGMTKNLNKGLSLASGKYFTWLGDDLILPEKIWDDVAELESLAHDFALVHSICQYVESDGKNRLAMFQPSFSSTQKILDDQTLKELILNEGGPAVPTVTFRTSVLREIGGWDESLLYEDKSMWYHLAAFGFKFRFRPFVTTLYRIHPGQLSNEIRPTALHYQMKLLLPYVDLEETKFHLNRIMGMAIGHSDFSLCLSTYKTVFKVNVLSIIRLYLVHVMVYSLRTIYTRIKHDLRTLKSSPK